MSAMMEDDTETGAHAYPGVATDTPQSPYPMHSATETQECDARDNDPPPRLMITKMVLENFKSYAGIKEIGPFHKCFSAVVGPNGSGKSNVIDAMLFVFGKRAKKLRLNKVSELIHKSDAVKNDPPQYARVSVHFQDIIDTGDGDDDYRVVPNTETIVTRIAKKDNSSTYKLDGRNSSFKEIATYLNSKGIDLDNNRFLILQGEVEMISMMPPKGKTENDEGLLEYLEDIIGSSKFVEATNMAAAKVEALTEIRQEKLNRVKAVEKEKDNLEGAKLEAEALLAKEREIRRKQNILYQIHAMKLDKEHDQLTQTRDDVAQKLENERNAILTATKRIEEIERGLSEQRKDYEITFKELKRTKEEFSAFERKDIKLREQIKHEQGQKKKILEKIKTEEAKEANAIRKREAALARIPELEHHISCLSQRKVTEDAKLEVLEDDAKAMTQHVRRELEVKTQELAPVKQERAIMQAALETAKTEMKILEDSTNRAKERLQSAEKELESIDATKAAKIQQLTEKENEKTRAKDTLLNLEKEDSELMTAEMALEKRHTDLVNQVEDARTALRSSGGSSRSKAVQGILNAAKSGGELSKVGVLGRLGDLATIHEKYDIAVSTACGGMLDNIVVQTTAGAQRCLEFLRKYNLGRASFIPLDKQKKGAHDHPVETPENAPRLFDLIVPSNFAVTPALFLAVGNTLVAPDMDTASRWAYESTKRWRVVTLNGNLIETTGTMSGGGKTARSGGMRIANSRGKQQSDFSEEDTESNIEGTEKAAQQAQSLLQECRKRRLDIKNEIRVLTKNIRSLEVAIPKLQLEIEGFATTRKELTKLVPELQAQCQSTPEEKEKMIGLALKVQKCEQDVIASAEIARRLEVEVAKLQQDILEAGGRDLRNQKQLCEKILCDLNEAENTLNATRLEVIAAEKAVSKATTTKINLEKSCMECQEILDMKEAEFKSLESGAIEVMAAYEQVKIVETEKRVALETASIEVDELKKLQADTRCKEIDLLGQFEALDKQINDNRKKQKHWEKEIARLRDVDHDEVDYDDEKVSEGMINPNVDCDKISVHDDDSSSRVQSSSNLSHSVLEKYDPDDIKQTIETLEAEKNLLAKNANMGAIAEYRKKETDYLSRVAELDQVSEERNAARKEHEELRRQRLDMFMDGFGVITLKLKEMYQMITLGGDAELELVDSLDPFSEGIVFSVRPPKKSWKNISNLSGGEKTLSSLSLVFALHHYKPTPLYVMDEIDAALDFKNVSIVANYIKERTKNAQFIIISLRNNMFELADRLVGIYKTNNCTKSVTINPLAFGFSGHEESALSDKSNLAPATALRREKISTDKSYTGPASSCVGYQS